MANKGKDTNNSQFFVTYGKNLTHLDGKHTIFGRVVGGLKVLDRLEDIEADEKNSEKPSVDVVIEKTTVHQNPWTKMEKEYEDGVAARSTRDNRSGENKHGKEIGRRRRRRREEEENDGS